MTPQPNHQQNIQAKFYSNILVLEGYFISDSIIEATHPPKHVRPPASRLLRTASMTPQPNNQQAIQAEYQSNILVLEGHFIADSIIEAAHPPMHVRPSASMLPRTTSMTPEPNHQQAIQAEYWSNILHSLRQHNLTSTSDSYNTEGCKGKLYGNLVDLLILEAGKNTYLPEQP